ncbi:AHH domain-containing protein [Novosphingobium sp.]|uniref:AHH domain-containing protein n=1 Tax=Novosphingobium sp. TaxID=1874826 RepID=UPI0025D55DE8|nr:AHH domain-containing protein [Novosphingobium sp.]
MRGIPFVPPKRRDCIRFRAVNCRNAPDYDGGLQRHHILPRQILKKAAFTPMLAAIGTDRLCFDDFRANGLLLPANDDAAIRHGLPLHRGPHNTYNAMVMERVGQIEQTWSSTRLPAPEIALCEAYERLALLQRALRRRLLDQQRRLRLNRNDPLGSGIDFAELDAMANALWPATEDAVS